MNLTEIVAVVGVVVLLVLAVCIGIELDTARQRHERQRLAAARRLRDDDRRADIVRRGGPLCLQCPYRDRA